ncbi:MAG: hydrogenase iron-sulfur subunit [Dehalococcoidales bacterium]|nr:hydrogenase iron-sulfur subunit [Dehalococcoidales bacterium]
MKNWPNILLFRCNFCSPAGVRLDPSMLKGSPRLRMIQTTCTGRIDPTFILEAFANGADGVLVAGCELGDCHYLTGNFKANRNMALLKRTLLQLGIEPERLRIERTSEYKMPEVLSKLNDFVDKVTELGPITPN